MTATQGDLASLSRFIFRAPSWYASVTFSLLIAAIAGIAAFDSRYIFEDAWQGIFFIGIPTLIASIVTPYVDRRLGGRLTPNRASLLALFCELIVVVIMTVASLVAVVTTRLSVAWLPSLGQNFVFDVLLAALASIFAIRLLAIMAVSQRSSLASALPASIQTVAAAVLLFVYSGTATFIEIGGPFLQSYIARPEQAPPELRAVFAPSDVIILVAICMLYGVAAWLFVRIIDQPWKRSLGVSVLDFGRGFIGHIAEGSRELEDFFEQLGEEAVVPVTVLSFREPDGPEVARFVLPMIHPGPMGEIGGGNLPERVAASAQGMAFPPHATAGHDFNLVTQREVDHIIRAADTAYERLEYSATASRAQQLTEGEATLIGQSFGENALMVSTYAPSFADDIDYAVGLSASAEARSSGLSNVMLVDAHNCNNGLKGDDLGHVTPGSRRSFDMIEGARRLGSELIDADQSPVELGVAWDRTEWTPMDGIGPLGVRVAVLDVDGQQTAYVLVDGNNMEPGLRERLVDALVDECVDLAEVMTTDTHIVNTVKATNQVGGALDQGALVDLVVDLTERACADRSPVEVGMATERAEVTVFGNDRTETLASHANAMISMGAPLAAAFIVGVLAVSALIFFLAP